MADDSILTLVEVASYLKVAEKTVLRMVHRNELPSVKVGNQWRFSRSVIDEWLHTRMQTGMDSPPGDAGAGASTLPPISRMMRDDLVVMHMTPGTKEQVLTQLVRPVVAAGLTDDATGLLDKLLQREQMVSTAVGQGIAFPHVRHPQDNPVEGPLLVVGRCSPGTDFAAPDHDPVMLFVLVCARNEVVHVRLMAALARLMHQRNLLTPCIKARDAAGLIAVFAARESQSTTASRG